MTTKFKISFLLLFLLAGLVVGTAVLAQSSTNFDLSWQVISSGGEPASSASFRMDGSVGQSLTSQPSSISTGFTIYSGYWPASQGTRLYLPLIVKN